MFGVEGIVLHASSLLASHSSLHCESRNVPSDRKRVQTSSNKHSYSICLFVCMTLCNKARPRQLQRSSRTTSVPWLCNTIEPCQDTSWLTIAAQNQYFLLSRAGLFHWQEFKNGQAHKEKRGKILECIDGRDPSHFSDSPQSETDSQQLVWNNLKLYWLKTQ